MMDRKRVQWKQPKLFKSVLGAQQGCSGRVLLLISATQSGSFVTNLRESLRLRDVRDEQTQFVALFKLGSTPLPAQLLALRDLTSVKGFETYTPLQGNEQLSFEPIDIDEGVYFPLTYRDTQYEVKISDGTKAMHTFLKEYGNRSLNSVVRVHRDVIEDGLTRHHGIWIDTLKLVQSHVFKRKFVECLTELDPPPKIIVSPGHDVGRKMAELAKHFWASKGVEIECHEHPNLSIDMYGQDTKSALFESISNIDTSQSILILDDALITGRRLAGYQSQLRNQNFLGRICYGVAIARPERLSEWKLIARRLEFRSRLNS